MQKAQVSKKGTGRGPCELADGQMFQQQGHISRQEWGFNQQARGQVSKQGGGVTSTDAYGGVSSQQIAGQVSKQQGAWQYKHVTLWRRGTQCGLGLWCCWLQHATTLRALASSHSLDHDTVVQTQLKGSGAHNTFEQGVILLNQETSHNQPSGHAMNAIDPRTDSSNASRPA